MPEDNRKLAGERIKSLLLQSEKAFPDDRAHKYARMARKLALRYNIRLPRGMKGRICRKCGNYLVPGKTSRVRVSPARKAVITTCLGCGNVSRHPFKKGEKLL